MLVLVGLAMWRSSSLVQATILGSVVIFTLTRPPAYYWILLLLVPVLPRPAFAPLALLCLWSILHFVTVRWSHPFYTQAWVRSRGVGTARPVRGNCGVRHPVGPGWKSTSGRRGSPRIRRLGGTATASGQAGIGSPAKKRLGFSMSN